MVGRKRWGSEGDSWAMSAADSVLNENEGEKSLMEKIMTQIKQINGNEVVYF